MRHVEFIAKYVAAERRGEAMRDLDSILEVQSEIDRDIWRKALDKEEALGNEARAKCAELDQHVRQWKARAERAEAALAELRDWPCEGIGCEVTLGSLESEPAGPGGGCWFCSTCWNKALPAARRHGAEAQREACARDFEKYIASSTTDDWVRERPPPSEHPSVRRIRATPLVTDKEPKR